MYILYSYNFINGYRYFCTTIKNITAYYIRIANYLFHFIG